MFYSDGFLIGVARQVLIEGYITSLLFHFLIKVKSTERDYIRILKGSVSQLIINAKLAQ